MKSADKSYLRQILAYLSSSSRAPWLVERGSNLNKELLRILDEHLRRPAQKLAIKVMDKAYVRESEVPYTLRLH